MNTYFCNNYILAWFYQKRVEIILCVYKHLISQDI